MDEYNIDVEPAVDGVNISIKTDEGIVECELYLTDREASVLRRKLIGVMKS